MRRHGERKKGKENRGEEGKGGTRRGRGGEGRTYGGKKRKTYNHSAGFPLILFFFLSLLGRRKRWLAGLVTGLESFSDLANSVFALD